MIESSQVETIWVVMSERTRVGHRARRSEKNTHALGEARLQIGTAISSILIYRE
jgi:hypothetical protein